MCSAGHNYREARQGIEGIEGPCHGWGSQRMLGRWCSSVPNITGLWQSSQPAACRQNDLHLDLLHNMLCHVQAQPSDSHLSGERHHEKEAAHAQTAAKHVQGKHTISCHCHCSMQSSKLPRSCMSRTNTEHGASQRHIMHDHMACWFH